YLGFDRATEGGGAEPSERAAQRHELHERRTPLGRRSPLTPALVRLRRVGVGHLRSAAERRVAPSIRSPVRRTDRARPVVARAGHHRLPLRPDDLPPALPEPGWPRALLEPPTRQAGWRAALPQ